MGRLKQVAGRIAVASQGRVVVVGMIGSARQAKGNSSTARGYNYRWQRAREAYLAAHPLCAMCSTDYAPVPATVVDHIKPHGGDDVLFWDTSNWQPLCKRCHDSTKQRNERQQRMGRGV